MSCRCSTEFRADPIARSSSTPSDRIELFSERIAGFGYDRIARHTRDIRLTPPSLGRKRPKHCRSSHFKNQPQGKLRRQMDGGPIARAAKRRPARSGRARSRGRARRVIKIGATFAHPQPLGALLPARHHPTLYRPMSPRLLYGAMYPTPAGARGRGVLWASQRQRARP